MPRIRYIKPEFAFDEDLAKLPERTRLFYILLWCHVDRMGRAKDEPGKLRALIFPYQPEVDVDAILTQLHPHHVRRYSVKNERLLQVNPEAWKKHQKPHVKEADSILPSAPKHTTSPDEHLPSTGSSGASTEPAALLMGMGIGMGIGRTTAPPNGAAVDYTRIRFPYGKHKGVYIAEMEVAECELYLRDKRLGSNLRQALEARIADKKSEAAGMSQKAGI